MMTSFTGFFDFQTTADDERDHQNDSNYGSFHYNLPAGRIDCNQWSLMNDRALTLIKADSPFGR
jgi:hypothetical protein